MILDEIINAQKNGAARGIVSICSANPWVLKAAMQRAAKNKTPLLIEATCNQVNQFGGYTGMTPADFATYVRNLGRKNGLMEELLLLGGDHLGPNVWQNETSGSAMKKSLDLVDAYVHAGFTKIHLDASMKLGGDAPGVLSTEVIARRTAEMAKTAEEVASNSGLLRYVIGSEVPVPGGSFTPNEADGLHITQSADVRQTIQITREAFRQAGLEKAWERVRAVVVQPGVEFGDDFILDYVPEKTRELIHLIETEANLVYEAHSSDYQERTALRNLVCDHFSILKVGPALTYALREAFFALSFMEDELYPIQSRSGLVAVLENVMLRDPIHWQKYYPGSLKEQAFKRKFSLSDRIRYYWTDGKVQASLVKLLNNMNRVRMPLSLVSQYAPWFFLEARSGEGQNAGEQLLLKRVDMVLDNYDFACGINSD